jgi:hypothetical protein
VLDVQFISLRTTRNNLVLQLLSTMSVLPRPTLPLTVEAMQAVRNAFPEDFQCAITVGELVKAGFRYLGPKDTVMCPYCALGLRNWQSEDKAMEQHRTRSPDC